MKIILCVVCLAICKLALAASGEDVPWFVGRLELLRGKFDETDGDLAPDTAGVVQSRLELGNALLVTREYEMAIKQYDLALALQQQEFRGLTGQDIVPRLIVRVDILTRVGNALLDSNRNNSRALRILNQAISLANWGVDSRHDAVRDLRTAHALALAHTLPIGDVDAFFRQLNESALNAYPQDHPVLARILDRWALINVANGKHAEAIDRVRKSLRIKEKAFGEQHPFVAESLAMLASLEYAHGDRELVAGLLQRVLDIRVAAFGDAHPITQTARDNIDRFRAPLTDDQ